jgi:hypothetical protein
MRTMAGLVEPDYRDSRAQNLTRKKYNPDWGRAVIVPLLARVLHAIV